MKVLKRSCIVGKMVDIKSDKNSLILPYLTKNTPLHISFPFFFLFHLSFVFPFFFFQQRGYPNSRTILRVTSVIFIPRMFYLQRMDSKGEMIRSNLGIVFFVYFSS